MSLGTELTHLLTGGDRLDGLKSKLSARDPADKPSVVPSKATGGAPGREAAGGDEKAKGRGGADRAGEKATGGKAAEAGRPAADASPADPEGKREFSEHLRDGKETRASDGEEKSSAEPARSGAGVRRSAPVSPGEGADGAAVPKGTGAAAQPKDSGAGADESSGVPPVSRGAEADADAAAVFSGSAAPEEGGDAAAPSPAALASGAPDQSAEAKAAPAGESSGHAPSPGTPTRVGMVIGVDEIGAQQSPIILVKAQVDRLAEVIQSLGLVPGASAGGVPKGQANPDGQLSPAQELAIDTFALVNALRQVMAQFASAEPGEKMVIALPPQAQKALEVIKALQGMLDKDGFADLLGALPIVGELESDSLAGIVRLLEPKASAPAGAADGKKAAVAEGHAAGSPTVDADGKILIVLEKPTLTPKPAVSKQKASEPLPEWIHDARQPAARIGGYTPQPKVPASPSTLDGASPRDAASASKDDAPAVHRFGAGEALRTQLDRQAAKLLASQRHSLPQNLQPLAEVPPMDSAEYTLWLGKIVDVVERSALASVMGADGGDASKAYVFEDPDISKLLQMLPVRALRDVVRGVGKSARQSGTSKQSLIESQGATRQVQLDAAGLKDSLEAQAHDDAARRGGEEAFGRAEATGSPAAAASGFAAAGSRAPKDASQERKEASRNTPPAGRAAAREASTDKAEKRRETLRFDRVEYRMEKGSGEGESAGLPAASGSDRPAGGEARMTIASSDQALRTARRQAQIARIAKHIRSQIALQVLRQVRSETRMVQMQLNPQRLGKIDVSITHEANGKVSIVFVVENPETLEALKSDASQLLQALRESGINTDGGAMHFSLKEGGSQQFGQDKKKTRVSGEPEEEEEKILAMGELAEIDEDGRVDVRV